MNCDDKYNRIIENARIRRKLNEFGICSIPGPTARCNKSSIYIFKW